MSSGRCRLWRVRRALPHGLGMVAGVPPAGLHLGVRSNMEAEFAVMSFEWSRIVGAQRSQTLLLWPGGGARAERSTVQVFGLSTHVLSVQILSEGWAIMMADRRETSVDVRLGDPQRIWESDGNTYRVGFMVKGL